MGPLGARPELSPLLVNSGESAAAGDSEDETFPGGVGEPSHISGPPSPLVRPQPLGRVRTVSSSGYMLAEFFLGSDVLQNASRRAELFWRVGPLWRSCVPRRAAAHHRAVLHRCTAPLARTASFIVPGHSVPPLHHVR